MIACRFDPQGRYVFAGSQDNSVQRWDLKTGKQAALTAHDSWVRTIVFDRKAQTTITGGYDGRLIWWETASESPKPLKTQLAHAGWLRQAVVSPDGKLLVTVGDDKLVKLWSLPEGKLVKALPGHQKFVYSVLFHPSGKELVSADLSGVIKHWELPSGKELRQLDAKKLYSFNKGQRVDFGGVRDMAFSPDGKHLACGGLINASNPLGAVHNPAVVLLDWASGKQKQLHQTSKKLRGVIWKLTFHKSGFLIGASGGGSGGYLLFWQPGQAKEIHQFKLPNTVKDMDLHPDGVQLATAHYDSRVRICEMREKPKKAKRKKK